jgi:formate hydrogenlyase subunit 4
VIALHWLTQILEVVAALLAAPLFVGWINQCRAWLQNKSAPSVLLPYRSIRKLFHKDAVLATNASPLFRIAPYVVFGAMVCAAAIIPSLGTRLPISDAADAIALVGLFATARVFMSLAAIDVGTAFGTLGATSRHASSACIRASPSPGWPSCWYCSRRTRAYRSTTPPPISN